MTLCGWNSVRNWPFQRKTTDMEKKYIRNYSGPRCKSSQVPTKSRYAMASASHHDFRRPADRVMTSYPTRRSDSSRPQFVHPNAKIRDPDESRTKCEVRKYLRKVSEDEIQKKKQLRYDGLFQLFLQEERGAGKIRDDILKGQDSVGYSQAARRLARRSLSVEISKELQDEATLEYRLKVRQQVAALFRAIRIVCSWYRSMKEKSMEAAEQATGVTQLYFYSVHGNSRERGGVTLAFDKSEFSRQKGLRLPLAVRTAATKLPRCRTLQDIQLIYKVLNSLKSFKDKYPEDIKRRICSEAWYMSCEKGRVIVRQGHLGMSFYFMFSGSAFVQLDTKDPVTGDTKSSVESILTAGTSFGELALLEDGGRRTVSIICKDPTELFQIDRDSFREICSDFYRHELQMKVDIARRYEVMSAMGPEQLRRLCFQSLIIPVPIGKVLEKDWSLAKHIYIVLEGSIQLLRVLDTSTISRTALEEATTSYPGHMLTKLSYWTDDSHKTHTVTDDRTVTEISSSKGEGLSSGSSHQTDNTYLTVGTLRKYNHSDLRILSYRTQRHVEPVIMVSQGAKVIRMSRNLIQEISDKTKLDNYLKYEYKPPEIPDRDSLMERFIRMSHWRRFRYRVTDTLARENSGQNMAMIPETRKLFNKLKVFT